MKVLLIEDSDRLRRSLRVGLAKEGFVVESSADGESGYEFVKSYEYDVIVLDLMLPRMPGLELLARIRDEGNHTPVLILSAKDEISDRVCGLDLGADDYLVKPFAFDELCARLRTLARRKHDVTAIVLQIGAVHIDVARRQCFVDNKAIELTPSEYRLLECLALRRGKVISRESLLELLRDNYFATSSNVVEVTVSTLRKKLRNAVPDEVIHTRRGFGYYVE